MLFGHTSFVHIGKEDVESGTCEAETLILFFNLHFFNLDIYFDNCFTFMKFHIPNKNIHFKGRLPQVLIKILNHSFILIFFTHMTTVLRVLSI